jgi:peroxiredoxin
VCFEGQCTEKIFASGHLFNLTAVSCSSWVPASQVQVPGYLEAQAKLKIRGIDEVRKASATAITVGEGGGGVVK